MEFLRDESVWLYLPLILWICGIFYLSSDKGSISNTSRFLSPIFKILFPKKKPDELKAYHLYLRKACHFFSYGILALFASVAFYYSPVLFSIDYWYVSAFATVLFVSSADEIKQSFSSNRVGSFFDVVLDCVGGLTMILIFKLFL